MRKWASILVIMGLAVIMAGCASAPKKQPIMWIKGLRNVNTEHGLARLDLGLRKDGVLLWRLPLYPKTAYLPISSEEPKVEEPKAETPKVSAPPPKAVKTVPPKKKWGGLFKRKK